MEEAQANLVYDAINAIESPNFFLWATVYVVGTELPSLTRLRRTLEDWVEALEPDDPRFLAGTLESLPTYTWTERGWYAEFYAMPKKPDARGKPGIRPLGAHGRGAAIIDDHTPLVRSLKSKTPGRYGEFAEPYVIAVLGDTVTLDDSDVAAALFGSEAVRFTRHPDGEMTTEQIRNQDGFWVGPPGVQNTRVSGVLVGRLIMPWKVAQATPRIWLNPYTSNRLPILDTLPWASALPDADKEEMVFSNAPSPMHQLFGLPADWPGEEDLC